MNFSYIYHGKSLEDMVPMYLSWKNTDLKDAPHMILQLDRLRAFQIQDDDVAFTTVLLMSLPRRDIEAP